MAARRHLVSTSPEEIDASDAVDHSKSKAQMAPASASASMASRRRLRSLWRVLTWLRLAIGVGVMAVAISMIWKNDALMMQSSTATPGMASPVGEQSLERAFLAWFHAAGGVANGISVRIFDGMGRGVIATHDIEENDLLLRVPREIIMCRDTIRGVLSPSLHAPFAQLEDAPDEYLTAFLVLEQQKLKRARSASTSTWAPYLAILPQLSHDAEHAIMSPLFFESDSDVDDLLHDDRMRDAARQERRRAQLAFHRFQRLFPKKNAVTWREYRWARFLINSRAFSLRGDRMLVPFGDLFNGRAHSRPREQANGQTFLQFHRLSDTAMEITADRATPAGQQVFEDYGDNDNYIYALYHGFLLTPNAFDCAALRLPTLSTTGDDVDSRMRSLQREILERVQVDDGPLVCISRDGRLQSRFDAQTLRFYQRLLAMGSSSSANEDDGDDKREILERCAVPHNFHECFLQERDRDDASERALLRQALQTRLETYPTSLAEDRRVLKEEASLTMSEHHAIRFRVSRKEIVEAAIRALEETSQQSTVVVNDAASTAASEQANEPLAQANEALDTRDEDGTDDGRVARFLQWIHDKAFPVNHVALRFISPAMGYGVVATKDLALGELYLSVPVDAVLDIDAADRSLSFRRRVLAPLGSRRLRDDLLLALFLAHEAFGPSAATSPWKPYIDMLPTADRLRSPLLWADDAVELQQLQAATDVFGLVSSYRTRIHEEFAWLARQLQKTTKLPEKDEPPVSSWLTLANYQWAAAVLDSRSIWWSGQRHLVPLLDMVNCEERHADGERPHTPHHTTLSARGDAAETHASWAFRAGEQVVENYGQPNYIYLLYHGFVLSGRNSHDCAHLQLTVRAPNAPEERQRLVATMERLQLFSWTPDVCVSLAPSTEKSSIDVLLHVALIAADAQRAIELERERPGEITTEHVAAALDAVRGRQQRLQTVATSSDDPSAVKTFIRQQATLMTAIESHLLERLQRSSDSSISVE
ncbi:hypothetical protein PINS_up000908 [Pythium insidiosum]|nr:hypothetical protein PINS_up000908 [Pythium insidiosum]